MSFDFKNVKNVRATYLQNDNFENTVSQKTAFSQTFGSYWKHCKNVSFLLCSYAKTK